MFPVLLYDNRFTDVTPTASATATGFDVRHIGDLRPYTFWQAPAAGTYYLTVDSGSPARADALGIVGHNLASAGATVQVESSDNGSAWTPRTPAIAPPNGERAFLSLFSEVYARHFRLKIVAASAAPYLAVALLGKALRFPFPPETPYVPFKESLEKEAAVSKAGHLLGATVRYRKIAVRARFKHVPRTWGFGPFLEFWEAHGVTDRPFLWAWDLSVFPEHVFFVRLTGDLETPLSRLSLVDELDLAMEGVRL